MNTWLGTIFFAASVIWYCNRSPSNDERLCYADFEHGEVEQCRTLCKKGFFGLVGMKNCIPWLTCADFSNISVHGKLGAGAVKTVYLAKWGGHEVALNQLTQSLYQEDFHHGLKMLSAFHPHSYVTQILGHCNNEYLTEYHRHRSAEHIVEMLETEKFHKYNTLAVRFGLCINYVELLVFLHNSSLGTRVMCDSNDLFKALNQLLVTLDLRLILNDLDALPEAIPPHVKIKCGHREIDTDFVAPEQRWPFVDRPFNDSEMPPYDEKSDIWKIPDICRHFLGNNPEVTPLVYHLFKIHQKCKLENPADRVSALDVLTEYKRIYELFEFHRN